MVDAACDPDGTSAAGLARLIADAFMLRTQAEMALWTIGGAGAELRLQLARLQGSLDQYIQALAMRIQILDGQPPRSLAELRALSSVSEPCCDSTGARVARLAAECGVLKDGCRMVALLARTSGDESTEEVVSRPVAWLEEAAWRLRSLASSVAQGSSAPTSGEH